MVLSFNIQPIFEVNGIPVHVGLKICSVFLLITIKDVLCFVLHPALKLRIPIMHHHVSNNFRILPQNVSLTILISKTGEGGMHINKI
jgi:hypothetical protein